MEKQKEPNEGVLATSGNLQPTLIAEVNNSVVVIREIPVLIDRDVAAIYGVATRDINKAVKNNPKKFPAGYYFELDAEEKRELVENFHRFDSLKHSTVMPKAFSEKGLYMLATILKSDIAIEATLAIIETFTKVRSLKRELKELHKETDTLPISSSNKPSETYRSQQSLPTFRQNGKKYVASRSTFFSKSAIIAGK